MGGVTDSDVTVRLPAGDDPEVQAARRRALEEALIGVRSARRARKAEVPGTSARMVFDADDPSGYGTGGPDGPGGVGEAGGVDEPGGSADPDDADPGDGWPTASTLPWIEQATCQGADPALFFGPDVLSADGRRERLSERRRRETRAKVFCAACPVRAACAEHALALPEPYGVWGGMGEIERLALLRRTVA